MMQSVDNGSVVAESLAKVPPPADPVVQLQGVSIDNLTEQEVIDKIASGINLGSGGCVVTVNLDHMRRCHYDPSYLELVKEAELVVADGMPLVWATRLQNTPLPERVAGSSLSLSLAHRLAEDDRTLFLLGGNDGVAEEAGRELTKRFAGLKIVGSYCPPFGFENDRNELDQITRVLKSAQPDVVYVALGSPKQERLIQILRHELPQTWWLGVGISLSFVTGDVSRAPEWVQRLGLEWGYRLIQEPTRLWRRYLVEGLPFFARMMATSLRRRWRIFN